MKSKEQHDNKQIEQTNEKHNGTSAASAFVYVDFDDTFAWTSQCLKLKHKNSLRYGFDRHSFIIRVISTIFVFWIQTVQCSIGSAELTELVHTNICLISICIKLCNFAWNIHNTFIQYHAWVNVNHSYLIYIHKSNQIKVIRCKLIVSQEKWWWSFQILMKQVSSVFFFSV